MTEIDKFTMPSLWRSLLAIHPLLLLCLGGHPNANLPLSQKLRHVLLALNSLGPGLAAAAALMFCIQLATQRKPRHALDLLGSNDWQLLCIGCAPAPMLAAKGAGLNFHMRALRAKLLASGLWQPVGEPLVASRE